MCEPSMNKPNPGPQANSAMVAPLTDTPLEHRHADTGQFSSHALQNAIFNSANFSCMATDAHGVIQIFNVGAERMLGYAAAEVIHQITLADMTDPQEVIARAKTLSGEFDTLISPGFEALVSKASHGIADIDELTYIRKDGSRFPALVSVTALRDAQDRIIGYLLISTDNTAHKLMAAEQKKLELESARQVADEANLAKSDFLASMSHEIRSPLNAILGLAYLLEQANLDPDATHMVHKIRASGRMLLSLISDILDVSKIEAGQMMIEKVPFRLLDVIDNLASVLGVAAGDKNIELIIQPPPAGIRALVGDALRLEQVLINLSINAIKFTHQGQVELRTEVLASNSEEVTLRFSVRDTGIGIAPELQGHVFTAFTQADSSTPRRFGGTGLGLAICRQLVGLMGGEIGLSSVLGQGSEFWFTLPLKTVSDRHLITPSRPGVPAAAQRELAGVRVLVVDDSEINCEVERRILNGQGAQVSLAANGQEALDWLQTHPNAVDLVLMDVQMPVMDGIEATRRLRQMPQFASLPIVALTAGACKSQQNAAHAAGMTHFISKPYDVPSTIAMILRLTSPAAACAAPDADLQALHSAPIAAAADVGDRVVIDRVKGLEIWNDAASYQQFLHRFVTVYQGAVALMQSQLQQSDRLAARALAHKLVGVAANMALPETLACARELDRVLQTDIDPAAQLTQLEGALRRAVSAIQQQFGSA